MVIFAPRLHKAADPLKRLPLWYFCLAPELNGLVDLLDLS